MESDRRLHPLSFVFAIQSSAKQFLVPAIVALFATRPRDNWEAMAVFFLVPIALVALGKALSVRYRLGTTELVLKSGFVFRRVRHIPYDRIQNVAAVQNVLHRLLNVLEVRIETGGGTETEAVLRVVDALALEEIRAATRQDATRHGLGDGGIQGATAEAVAADEARVLLRMSPRDLALFGLIHGSGMLVVGALFGALWEFGLFDRIAETSLGERAAGRGVVRQLARSIFGGGPMPMEQLMISAVGIVLLLGAFRFLSALWMAIKYYDFRLTRAREDLRCEYGFFTRFVTTIPIRRIQRITVRESPWHRLAGRQSLHALTAGGTAMQANESTTTWLAPLIAGSDLQVLLAAILPDLATDADWQPVHPRAVRREFVGTFAVLILPWGLLAWTAGWWAFGLLPFLAGWALFHARRSIAATRWAISDATVHFKRGWLWRSEVTAPLSKVQAVSRHESPIDRRHGMASVFADTAGHELTGHSIHIPYLPAAVAGALARRLSEAAARTTFRW